MRIKPSQKYVPFVYVLLGAVLWISGAAAGHLQRVGQPTTKLVQRPRISPHASYAQVMSNFSGRAYVHGSLSELPGYACEGWTHGKNGHGWVTIVCVA